MDASTRILRGLVVLEWLLLVPLTAAELRLVDSLPAELRDYEPDVGGVWLGVALFASAVWVAASLGVFLLWRPARLLYVLATAVLLATQPAFGAVVVPPWKAPLQMLGAMATGAVIALLYLSPAAAHFGSAPPAAASAPKPSRTAFGAGLTLGFLAAVGALALAFIGFGFAIYRAEERESADGREFGTTRDARACLEAAEQRPTSFSFSGPGAFLSACLTVAAPSEGFCDGVPAYATPEAPAWLGARCGNKPSYDDCVLLAEAIQQHCHPGAPEDDGAL